jgi:hypothetical protein
MADDLIREVQLNVQPAGESAITVNLEPTGMQYRLEPGELIRVVVKGPGTGVVDVSHVADTIVVCTWAGGAMQAYDQHGNELHV